MEGGIRGVRAVDAVVFMALVGACLQVQGRQVVFRIIAVGNHVSFRLRSGHRRGGDRLVRLKVYDGVDIGVKDFCLVLVDLFLRVAIFQKIGKVFIIIWSKVVYGKICVAVTAPAPVHVQLVVLVVSAYDELMSASGTGPAIDDREILVDLGLYERHPFGVGIVVGAEPQLSHALPMLLPDVGVGVSWFPTTPILGLVVSTTVSGATGVEVAFGASVLKNDAVIAPVGLPLFTSSGGW